MEGRNPVNQGKPKLEFGPSTLDNLIERTVSKFNDPNLKAKGEILIQDLVWRILQNPEKLENMLKRTIVGDINARDVDRYTMDLFPEKKTPEEIQAQFYESSKEFQMFSTEEMQQILAAGAAAAKLMFPVEEQKEKCTKMFSLQSIPTFLAKNLESEPDTAAFNADSDSECTSSKSVAEKHVGENIKLEDNGPHFSDMKMFNSPQQLDAQPEVTAPKNLLDCSSSSKELEFLDPARIQLIRKLENKPEISNLLNRILKSRKKT